MCAPSSTSVHDVSTELRARPRIRYSPDDWQRNQIFIAVHMYAFSVLPAHVCHCRSVTQSEASLRISGCICFIALSARHASRDECFGLLTFIDCGANLPLVSCMHPS